MEFGCEVETDLTEALNGDGHSFQAITAVEELCSGANTVKHADGGHRGRIAADVGTTDDIVCLAEHNVRVMGVGVDILCGEVFSAEGFDRFGIRFKQRIGLLGRIGNDNALTATDRQSCRGVLETHTAGKTQNVEKCVVKGLVRPKTATADRRSEFCAMYRDDTFEARFFVLEKSNLFVSELSDHFYCTHFVFLHYLSFEISYFLIKSSFRRYFNTFPAAFIGN